MMCKRSKQIPSSNPEPALLFTTTYDNIILFYVTSCSLVDIYLFRRHPEMKTTGSLVKSAKLYIS
jgi:hypothetical protein